MKYFSKSSGRPVKDYKVLKGSIDEAILAGKNYNLHLQGIAPKLPPETREFVMSAAYQDFNSHDCPHDAWLQELVVAVKTDADKNERVDLQMILLGSFHDRILTFEYTNVIELNIDLKKTGRKQLGDWLHDEFDINDEGFVSHEILWQFGKSWRIVSKNITFLAADK